MKLLVADKFSTAHLDELGRLGLEVVYKPELSAKDLPGAMAGVTMLVVRSTEVSAATFAAAESLSLVVRAGAGVNTIDRAAASQKGVFVANCPGKNALAVAELAFALLGAIDRRIPDQVADLRAGTWNKKEYGKADGIYGKTMGILGLGAIGRAVAERARAFGMPVLAWSRSLDDRTARALGVERAKTPVDVARAADVVSVHLPLGPDTKGIVGEELLAVMKPRAILLNTARSEVVDEAALVRAVKERGLRVGLDVHAGEPDSGTGSFRSALLDLPGVYGTHHVGASTSQAEAAIADEAIRVVRTFLAQGSVPNCVNLRRRSPAKVQLVVRHLDRVGVLAEVLGALRRHSINVEEMDNQLFDAPPGGVGAACCTIRLPAPPSDACLAEIRAHADVLYAGALPLP
jgi:D-3-phosphoglycerate dehydrogenase / 2-oxoglutarate reductase